MKQTTVSTSIDDHIDQNLEKHIATLGELCAFPSISAQNQEMDKCASYVADRLEEIGVRAQILESKGAPVVYGEAAGRSDKTLLFYLHYDVQPAEPLELWDTPPFELNRVGDRLYARGIVDDKGHIVARLAAVAAVLHAFGEFPCNIKFIVEGEEEIGSPNLASFVYEHRDLLAADGCIWEFGGVDFEEKPVQTLGMRGIFYVELSVRTANRDVHSGLGGSIFPNAAWRLVWALNSLKGSDERIRIRGFYDNVRPASERDLALLSAMPDNAANLKEMYGLDSFIRGLEGGLEFRRAAVFEPTCTICGLDSGYQGSGSKTVQPAEARAKVDFRIVPDQTPEEILSKLRSHLDEQGFSDVIITTHGATRPSKIDPDHPLVLLSNQAAAQAYGKPPIVQPMTGGSGPNFLFAEYLGLPIVTAGVGYPGNNIHAPNEHIRIGDFVRGARHTAYIIEAFGRN